jgi:phosphate acetyltransferase
VLIFFPDLNTATKAVQRETVSHRPHAAGSQQTHKRDLSRGCTVDDIYNTVPLTAIQAQEA